MGKIRCQEYCPQCVAHLESTRQAENVLFLRMFGGCVIRLPLCPERVSCCSQICKDLCVPGVSYSGHDGTPLSRKRAPHSSLHSELN